MHRRAIACVFASDSGATAYNPGVINDTDPRAERVQIELIRNMPPEKRAALASRLRNRTYWMARRAIDQARPELSEADRKLLFIEVHYGVDLARRVREDWSKRSISDA